MNILSVPAHKQVAGNKKADEFAKATGRRQAPCREDKVSDELRGRPPLALPWSATEARSRIEANKAVFDAVIFAIYQALRVLDQRQASVPRYTVFVDSTTTIDRDPEPG